MKKLISKIIIFTLAIGTVYFPTAYTNSNVYAKDDKISAPKNVRAYRMSGNSLKIKWAKNKQARGYVVYRYNKKLKKYKKIKTIKKKSVTSWTDKKLKTNKVYRYKVKAFTKVSGKKQYSDFSRWIKAVTHKKNADVVNVGMIKNSDSSMTLGLMDSLKLSAKVKPSKKSKALAKRVISKNVRWVSSNKNLATVNDTGKVKTKGKTGTCYIYSIAHNGKKAKTKIKIKDYAKPKSFDYSQMNPVAANILKENKDAICEIASFFSVVNPRKVTNIDYEEGKLAVEPIYVKLGGLEKTLTDLLAKYNEDLSIYITDESIAFIYTEVVGYRDEEKDDPVYRYHNIEYLYNDDVDDHDVDFDVYKEIAEHWAYYEETDSF